MSIATYDQATLTYNSAVTDYDGSSLGVTNMPVVGVFVSFTDGPYIVEPNWIEITQYVRDINVRRGRGNDLQQFTAGSASLTLDNRTRLFDPFNTAGTYYGNLKPRRQIKIVGQYAGVTYPIFRGFIAGFPVGYTDGGKDSTVQIDCFDAIGLLASETTPNDWAYYYTSLLSPLHYWRCNDSESSALVVDTAAVGQPDLSLPAGSKIVDAPPMANGLLSNSMYIQNRNAVAADTSTALSDFTVMFWGLNPSQQSGGEADLSLGYYGSRFEMQWQNTADPFFDITNNTRRTRYTITGLNRQLPVHFAFAVSINAGSDPTAVVYVNGVVVTPSVTYNAFPLTYSTLYLSLSTIQVQEIVLCSGVKTATQITNVYKACAGRVSETTTSRFALLESLTDFPAALTSFASTTTTSVSELNNSQFVLNEMQTLTDGELGELYVDRSGVLTFLARDWFATSARSRTPQATFTDTGTGVYYDHNSLRMAFDADLVRNDMTVSFTGNGNANYVDAGSVAAYGSASDNLNTYLADSTQAKTLANLMVNIYKNPKLRIEPFLVKGQRNPTYDWQYILGLELLDRFTFKRTPSTGSAVSQDMLLQSIEHRITANTWETVVNGSARFTDWFIIGLSLIGGTDLLL